jgi:hypothetical protein
MHEQPIPAPPSDTAVEAGAGPGPGAAGSSALAPAWWLRFDRYQDLTCYAFGPRAGRWALLPFQSAVLVGLAITYTVVGGDDLHAIAADYSGSAPAAWVFYVAFGGGRAGRGPALCCT